MAKTRVSICLLLLFLSLFTTMSALPVEARDESLRLESFAVKEYKQWSSYNPSYTFSQSGDSVLRMMSNDPGLGDAYAFMHLDRDYLDGKKLRISWRWYYDWTGDYVDLADVFVVNHEHNRKLINSGEFRTQGDAEHPVTDYIYVTACSYATTSNGGWVNWQTDTSGILDLSSFTSSVVTIIIKNVDYWTADTVGLEVDYLQILDSNNNVLKTYHFQGYSFMESGGYYYDYGIFRRASFITYGTEDYYDMSAPGNEYYLSSAVASYQDSLVYNTGKYPSGYHNNAFGSLTTNDYVHSYTVYTEQVADYSSVFYKGHIAFLGYEPFYYYCNCPDCTLTHYGIWARNRNYEPIEDFSIDDAVNYGRDAAGRFYGNHDFVFNWACDLGSEGRIGVYNRAHSSGILPSWMDISPSVLNVGTNPAHDGYLNPDQNDHVYISFDGVSMWYDYEAELYNYDYAQFVAYFYDRLMNGYTVRQALDEASYLVNGVSYQSSDIGYDGYQIPVFGVWQDGRMRVWGDGDHIMPH